MTRTRDGKGVSAQDAEQPSAALQDPGDPSGTSGSVGSSPSLDQVLRAYLGKIKGGDMGALPAVLGIIALCVVFSVLRPTFFTPGNFANLLTQGAAVTVIAMGLVFVLLLGEIDLSAGVTSGVCGAVLAVLMTRYGLPLVIVLPVAVGTGTVIGVALGSLVSYLRIPSFIVTLAAFLAFQGAVLLIIGEGGNVPVRDRAILAVANNNLPPLLGWALLAGTVGLYGVLQITRAVRRRSAGLPAVPWGLVAFRVGGLLVVSAAAVYVLNLERSRNVLITSLKGVPVVVPVLLVLYVVLTFVLDKTTYGRHIYAVGGNAEAARRAGIRVKAIRVSVFVIASSLAAIGGIVAASRANSVDPNAGGSNVLLYAVGAAVIGGTSLYGGRGRVRDAVLGGAVVAIIDNGMGLLGYSSGVKFVVTGLVLLVAAGVDALSRRRAQATGRG